jgi:hypothetical protein
MEAVAQRRRDPRQLPPSTQGSSSFLWHARRARRARVARRIVQGAPAPLRSYWIELGQLPARPQPPVVLDFSVSPRARSTLNSAREPEWPATLR